MKKLFKKCIILLLALITCIAMCVTASAIGEIISSTYILGDADGDGKVIIKDATRIQKIVAKILPDSEKSTLAGDVDFDGKLTVKDATLIQKYLAKMLKNSRIGELIIISRPVVYTVVYNANGGSGTMANQEFTYDKAANLRANSFTRTGYTFLGWATSASGAVVYQDKQSVSKLTEDDGAKINLHAVWKPNTYAVVYNPNGGSGKMSNQEFVYGQAGNLTANAFTRTGHKFSGWATSASGAVVYQNKQSVSNLTAANNAQFNLYAVWTPHKYNVVFNANGGTGTMGNQEFTYGQSKALAANVFTHSEYKFAGWATSASGSVVYKNSQNVVSLTEKDGDKVNLYAVWKPTYTIVYNANGGAGTMDDQTLFIDETQALAENAFTRTGYHVTGWATSSGGALVYQEKQEVKGLASVNRAKVNLYAIWEINRYTVVFNANGGTGTMDKQEFIYGQAKTLNLNSFTRPGYTMSGWSNSADGKVVYSNGGVVSKLTDINGAEINLYAVWKPNEYIVSFNAKGGTGAMKSQSFTYGMPQVLNANTFLRKGYSFAGWATYASGGAVVYQDKESVSNLTDKKDVVFHLYAVWNPNTYTVVYNANGGSGTMANQDFSYDKTGSLAQNKFTRPGYTFLGWATSAGGSVVYQDGQNVSNITDTDGIKIFLYAVWKAN